MNEGEKKSEVFYYHQRQANKKEKAQTRSKPQKIQSLFGESSGQGRRTFENIISSKSQRKKNQLKSVVTKRVERSPSPEEGEKNENGNHKKKRKREKLTIKERSKNLRKKEKKVSTCDDRERKLWKKS